jgi:DNA-binding HxlR family transcriptional regulator
VIGGGSVPATVRYDEQYCPIARALDVLGDRWTLLILRELNLGDQRFTDLRQHLPGIAPTVLTQRLRMMSEQGLVETKELPAPAARTVYTLTERGRGAVPVLAALARWGMPLLEEPDERPIRPRSAINMAVANYYDAVAAAGVDERYLFKMSGEEITLASARGGRGGAGRGGEADLVLESEPRVWLDIRQGRLTLSQAKKRGLLKVTGSKEALAHFQQIYRLS